MLSLQHIVAWDLIISWWKVINDFAQIGALSWTMASRLCSPCFMGFNSLALLFIYARGIIIPSCLLGFECIFTLAMVLAERSTRCSSSCSRDSFSRYSQPLLQVRWWKREKQFFFLNFIYCGNLISWQKACFPYCTT